MSTEQNFQIFKGNVKFNKKVSFQNAQKISVLQGEDKFSGGVLCDDKIYTIISSETRILEIDTQTGITQTFGALSEGAQKFSGGCLYNGFIYGFPRSANTLLKIDPQLKKAYEIELYTHYNMNTHHLSGIKFENTIYLAPFNAKHILAIDLETYKTKEIGKNLVGNSSYCGSVLHPNGLIYFLPFDYSPVMVLNPQNENITFTQNTTFINAYSGVVATNGNIYGFCDNGIFKIDINTNTASLIKLKECENIGFGTSGTKLSLNGDIYSVSSDGQTVIGFNPVNEQIKIVSFLNEKAVDNAFFGGITDKNGDIWFIPNSESSVLRLEFSKGAMKLSKNLVESNFLNG